MVVVVVVVLRICHIGQTKIIFPKPTDKAFADKFRLFIKGMANFYAIKHSSLPTWIWKKIQDVVISVKNVSFVFISAINIISYKAVHKKLKSNAPLPAVPSVKLASRFFL